MSRCTYQINYGVVCISRFERKRNKREQGTDLRCSAKRELGGLSAKFQHKDKEQENLKLRRKAKSANNIGIVHGTRDRSWLVDL